VCRSQFSAQPFARTCPVARSPCSRSQHGPQPGDLGAEALELAGLVAAKLIAAFESRPQVGRRLGILARDRRAVGAERGQRGEGDGELGGDQAGRLARGAPSDELLGDGESESLDRHAACAIERVELIGRAVEHGGQLAVVRDRDGAV
jgi:hypothetical protein